MINWSDRYPQNWRDISLACKNSTKNKCCNCWQKTAKHSHHSRYRLLFLKPRKWSIGLFLFPLCENCHIIAHSKSNYFKDSKKALWGNKNRLKYVWILRLKYWFLRLIQLVF